jgi:membrane associated rhomboid family serine protease
MGIYDREYYRREGPSFLGAFTERGLVCKWLVGINIICFLLQIFTREQILQTGFYSEPFTKALLLNVHQVLHGQVWRLLTYGFLHDTENIWHIVFNMLFLFWFGQQVEERLGSGEFLAFYLGGIVVAALAFMGPALAGWTAAQRTLGASGGVMAVLVLAALYNPRQVIYLFFLIPVPIWGFVIFLVLNDAFAFIGRHNSEVAVTAHLGGAAFGFVYFKLGQRITDLLPSFSGWTRSRAKPRLRLYREEDEAVAVPAPAARRAPARLEDEQLEAQMDAILAKIPRVGMEGLTESERQLLMRASEAIKRKRS